MSAGGMKASSNASLADPITMAGGNSCIFRVAAKMERERKKCHCNRENTVAAYTCCVRRRPDVEMGENKLLDCTNTRPTGTATLLFRHHRDARHARQSYEAAQGGAVAKN